MHLTILQHDISWCRPDINLPHLDHLISTLPHTDLLLLPEMFATGLNNNPRDIVDYTPGIINWMKAKAQELDAAVVGSLAAEDTGSSSTVYILCGPTATSPPTTNATSSSMEAKHNNTHAAASE